ncbi:MAG: response regulator [Desulfobulbaceae bacterium]|uniref:Response regulator n=1 Tax=Candidatus Desulfobia pelagia TaxID=2841692 RepID=A0A8J6NDF0_9BACT|nr:response regulator [Candidatus Desulfobia pelagia]
MAYILLIDDDPQICIIFKQILEAEGHSVVTASNGQEGIDIFRKNRADLIITDMVMPVKDGIKTIMELEREFSDLKVIAISGGGVIEPDRYLALAECIGIKQTLTKPITRAQLINAVNEVLDSQ